MNHGLSKAGLLAAAALWAALPPVALYAQAPANAAATAPDAAANAAADRQFLFAHRLLQRGEDAAAGRAFDEFLAQFPRDLKRDDALYYRALLLRKAGQVQAAATLLAPAAKTSVLPPFALPLLRGQIHEDLGQHQEALKALEAIALDGLDPTVVATVCCLRAAAYRALDNLPAAQSALAQAAAADSPLKARALLELANLLKQLGKNQEALQSAKQCLERNDPQLAPPAALLCGDLALALGQKEEAVAAYRQVITRFQSSPQFAPAIVGLCWAQFQAGQHDAVLASFAELSSHLAGADKLTGQYLAGSAQAELGKHEEAAALLASAAAAPSPVRDKALFKLARSQMELARYDPLEQTAAQLAQLEPKSPLNVDVQFLLGVADVKRGQGQRGIDRLSAIIAGGAAHPYYAQALLQRGKLYQLVDKLKEAAGDFRTFRDLAAAQPAGGALTTGALTTDALLQAALGLIDLETRLGRTQQALTDCQWLLARADLPAAARGEALYQQGLLQIQLKQNAPALASFDKLLALAPAASYLAAGNYYKGLLLMSSSQGDAALPVLQAALTGAELPLPLRVSALQLAAMQLRQQGKADAAASALGELEKLQGLTALDPAQQLWLAEHWLNSDRAEVTLKYLEPLTKAGAAGPVHQQAKAWLLTARAQRKLGQNEPAIAAYRQAIALGQGLGLEARLQLAQLLGQQKQYDAALAQYKGLYNSEDGAVAAQAFFDSALLYNEIALASTRQSDAAGATANIDQARWCLKRLTIVFNDEKLSPLPQLAFIDLAELDVRGGKSDLAKAALQELLQSYPQGPYAMFAKARLAALENRKSDALFLLGKLKEQPVDAVLLLRVTPLAQTLEGP